MCKFFQCYFKESYSPSNEIDLDFTPVSCKLLPRVLSAPIEFGLCSYKDIYELELFDFICMNELLMVKWENERRANRAAEKKSN